MQIVDINGNIFGSGLEVTGPDGKPKTISGGGSPSGLAGGDLSGSYPNPGVVWANGLPTYDLQYYPLSLNPAGYINSSALIPYLTSAIASSTYQNILISGTNIKTINSNSLLGSGDIAISSNLSIGTTPVTSGAIGRLLFEGTGNVVQQSSNLFFDNTNGRLGVKTSTPLAIIHSDGSITSSSLIGRANYLKNTLIASANNDLLVGLDISPTFTNGAFTGVVNIDLRTKYANIVIGSDYGFGSLYGFSNDGLIQVKTAATYKTQMWFRPAGNAGGYNSNYWSRIEHDAADLKIIGSNYGKLELSTNLGGASSGKIIFTGATGVANNSLTINGPTNSGRIAIVTTATSPITFTGGNILINTTTDAGFRLDVNGTARVQTTLKVGGTTAVNTSSILDVESNTKGFLPPRMTTTQKNAIVTPAAGLLVYDSTINKLCVFTTVWETITST